MAKHGHPPAGLMHWESHCNVAGRLPNSAESRSRELPRHRWVLRSAAPRTAQHLFLGLALWLIADTVQKSLFRPAFSTIRSAGGDGEGNSFEARRDALKRCLAREYTSFFRPFEADFYSDAVTFRDPLNNLEGKESYRKNVEMLSGESLVGNVLFTNGYIDLHAVEDVPGDARRLRTRWTLGFTFQLLPWRPEALFTGISEYEIDDRAVVLSQRDYWDTISLSKGGAYSAEAPLTGVADLVAQLLPLQGSTEYPAAGAGEWSLLRRAETYRIYRSEQAGFTFAVPALSEWERLSSTALNTGFLVLEAALRRHGLTPGVPLKVSTTGRGHVVMASGLGDGMKLSDEVVPGLQLLSPHPWEGEPPPM